jgi:hypothetical protein
VDDGEVKESVLQLSFHQTTNFPRGHSGEVSSGEQYHFKQDFLKNQLWHLSQYKNLAKRLSLCMKAKVILYSSRLCNLW